MAKTQKLSEAETIHLIRFYGERIADVGKDVVRSSRADLVEWAQRIFDLTRTLPTKNSAYLADD